MIIDVFKLTLHHTFARVARSFLFPLPCLTIGNITAYVVDVRSEVESLFVMIK